MKGTKIICLVFLLLSSHISHGYSISIKPNNCHAIRIGRTALAYVSGDRQEAMQELNDYVTACWSLATVAVFQYRAYEHDTFDFDPVNIFLTWLQLWSNNMRIWISDWPTVGLLSGYVHYLQGNSHDASHSIIASFRSSLGLTCKILGYLLEPGCKEAAVMYWCGILLVDCSVSLFQLMQGRFDLYGIMFFLERFTSNPSVVTAYDLAACLCLDGFISLHGKGIEQLGDVVFVFNAMSTMQWMKYVKMRNSALAPVPHTIAHISHIPPQNPGTVIVPATNDTVAYMINYIFDHENITVPAHKPRWVRLLLI